MGKIIRNPKVIRNSKIIKKTKLFYLTFGIIDAILLAATVFLLVAAMLFRGGKAPALFGRYIFLAETDAFSAVKKGSALIVDPVELKTINPGNIIIFNDENGENDRIGEVQDTVSDGGIYTFTVRTDADNNITVGQSRIVGKGMYYSEFLGAIISFAVSPAGVCLIAILPCVAFVIFEIAGIMRRRAPLPSVETVKKQYETPTYIPPGARYDPMYDDRPAFPEERQRMVEAAGLFTPPPPPMRRPEPPPRAVERAPISGRDIDKLIRETKARHERDAFVEEDMPPMPRQGRAAAAAAYRAVVDERSSAELMDEDERPHIMPEQAERPVQAEMPRRPEMPRQPEIPRRPEMPRQPEIPRQPERFRQAERSGQAERPRQAERSRQRAAEPVRHHSSSSPKVKYVPRAARLDSLLREDSAEDEYDDIEDILSKFEANK